ncbi:MAG TPA: tRNA (adenosine(37)-N6)-dimethylallyltransferase MiaA [Pyrinomonadaceae bacterium]|nr:tRNA (adenosine(37)-N6)-dimethylallyltransferase MiaA [Pyrinomonadaceae bacterium]
MSLSNHSQNPVIAIVGPTASGKSALGIEMALRASGEIINCDSVQVYRGIEIATAKVPPGERRGVPHHLIDFVPPEINYTAGEWARAAASKIEEVEARGCLALLVGGTGFYLRALRQPFFPSPPTDERLRRRLSRIRERRGTLHLHEILRRLDPTAASRLHAGDWPRVQRALEVRLQTGRPISEQQPSRAQPHESAARVHVFALLPPRAELYQRINARTEAHFAAGLVEEVRQLLREGVPAVSNALGAHGYRRVVEYLQGKRDLQSAIEQTKLDVRHYAKRQLTWFRREPGVEWFEGFGEDPLVQERVAARIEDLKWQPKASDDVMPG